MQKSSKIESVVPFVVWNLWCIKMFGENSFTSWVTRKFIFDFLGWLVWISAHLAFISCVMILKKRFEKNQVRKSKLPSWYCKNYPKLSLLHHFGLFKNSWDWCGFFHPTFLKSCDCLNPTFFNYLIVICPNL